MQKREVQLTLEGETFAGILPNTSITIHARRKIFIILVFLSISLEYFNRKYFNHKKTKNFHCSHILYCRVLPLIYMLVW